MASCANVSYRQCLLACCGVSAMNRDGCWAMYRSTSSLLWPPTNGGYLYALMSQFTVSMQHATERVERSGESQQALDGKKNIICGRHAFGCF